MSNVETILRFMALPIAVFLAVIAMWWGWATYPRTEDFFLERILPFYSLYLTLAAVSMKAVSGEIKQFLIITTAVSSLFMVEIFLRVVMKITIF